jgi:hypothetical protein
VKKVKSFENFINESIRDLMKPKSFDELKRFYRKYVDIITEDGFMYFPNELASYNKFENLVEHFVFLFEKIKASNEFIVLIKKLFSYISWWENCFFSQEQDRVIIRVKETAEELNELLTDDMKEKLIQLVYGDVNENVRDLMKPKSEEDIEKAIQKLNPDQQLLKGSANDIVWLVKQALDNGADVHTQNDAALQWACMNGHIEVVKILLDAGAHVTRNGYAMQLAKISGHNEIVKLLKQHTIIGKIKNFIGFNESVRDLMKPKSEEEIKKVLDKIISLKDKLHYINKYKLQKLINSDELKEMLLDRIHNFFRNSDEKEYLFFSYETRNIDNLNMFDIFPSKNKDDINGKTVVGIDEESVILRNDDWIGYEDLSISDLQNVVQCFIEPIEDKIYY